jgi:uncharacterized LabA/DUF88 family protein
MGGISGGGAPYRGPKEVKYLFIDGGYFRKAIENFSKKYFKVSSVPIDFSKLGRAYTKCFYYDCLPPQLNGEIESDYIARKQIYSETLDLIRSTKGFHVFEGVTTGRKGKERQKQVDVKIAVDMLMHTVRHNMHETTLLAGDQDFKPLVNALVQEGMYINLLCEKFSASK